MAVSVGGQALGDALPVDVRQARGGTTSVTDAGRAGRVNARWDCVEVSRAGDGERWDLAGVTWNRAEVRWNLAGLNSTRAGVAWNRSVAMSTPTGATSTRTEARWKRS